MSDQWETFCDVGYYHMWRLRRITERGWNDGFHINTKAEAEGLCELLNKLEREVAETQEQRDRLAEALREIADCDFVITLPDRMDAVRAIAREALSDINWYKS